MNVLAKLQAKSFVFAFMLLYSISARTQETAPEFFALIFENDLFVGDDAGYTNGMGISFGRGPFTDFNDDNLPGWLHWLSKDLYISTLKNKQRGVAHMFFQRMQTPENISSKELIIDDVPYAGLLAWQGTLYAWDEQLSDQLSLYLGVVGPITLAEQSQTFMHRLMSAEKPEGWDNQIENEFVFKVEAQRVWSLYRVPYNTYQFDVLGLYGAGIGNLESATQAGFAIRWGSNLQQSFATFSLDADRQLNALSGSLESNFYLFFGAKVGLVFNNIFIEGNSVKKSHSVPLEHVQNQISTGVVWNIGKVASVFQFSSISSSTELTDERNTFGAVSLSYGF